MKPTPSLLRFAPIIASLAMATSVHAIDGTWNGSTNTTWDTTGTNWTGAVTWGTPAGASNKAIFNGATVGTINLGAPVFANALQFDVNGYTIANGGVPANTLTLAGTTPTVTVTNSTDTATISAIVAGSAGLTKTGAGTLSLTGANTYTGTTFVNNGTLNVGFTNTSAHALTGGYTVASGAVLGMDFGAQSNATINTIAGNIVVNGTLNLASKSTGADGSVLQGSTSGFGISGAGVINKNDTGRLEFGGWNPAANALSLASFSGTLNVNAGTLGMNFQGAPTFGSTSMTLNIASGATFDMRAGSMQVDKLTGSGAYTNSAIAGTLTVGGNNGSSQFGGVISGATALTKTGTGMLTLTGANTNSGGTTVNRGVLNLDFSATGAPGSNILLSTGALTLGGGNLTLTGKTSTTNSQTVSGLTLTAGTGSSITLNANATANPLLLQLNAITRGAGSTVNFVLPTGTQSASNGILTSTPLGNWATVGSGANTQYATRSGSNIVAITGTAVADNTGLIDTTGTVNYDLASATGAPAATFSANTIRHTGSGGTTAPGTSFTVNSLMNAGTGLWTIGTGTITIGTNSELVVNTANSDITLSGIIQNNGVTASALTKTGSGTLTLSGANTYTGKTYLGAGVTQISADNNLGTAPASAVADQLTFGGGTLRFGAAMTLVANRGVTLNGAGGTFDTNGFDSSVAGIIAGTGGLTKTGAGILTLSNSSNTYTGFTNVKGGTLVMQAPTNANWVAPSGTKTVESGATLKYIFQTTASTFRANSIGANVVNSGGVLELNGTVATADSNYINAGSITGSGSLIKTGSGYVSIFNGSSIKDFTGNIDVQVGTLGTNNSDWGSSAGLMNLNITGGATFDVRSGSVNINQLTGSGTITGSSTPGTLSIGNNNGSSSFSGSIQNTVALTKNGTGTLTLSGLASTYTGVTTINSGTLEVKKLAIGGATSSIGQSALAATNLVINGGKLQFTGTTGNGSTDRLFIIGTNGATLDGSSSDNTALTFSNTGSLATTAGASNRTLTLTGTTSAATLNSLASAITDPTDGGKTALTKSGGNTWLISGTNTYTGATNVDGGKLVVNGNISTSATTVNNGGTLGGSGTLGALTVASGGTLAPGNSPGILNAGDTNLQAGSSLNMELNGATVGTQYDQLNVTGTVTLAGALNLTMGFTPANNALFFILANDSNDVINGTFDGLANNSTFTSGGQDFQISYFGNQTSPGVGTFTGGNDVVLMAIPEPNVAALLGGLGMLALLRRRRA